MKKLASLLLAGIMIIGSVPFTASTAFALENEPEYKYDITASGDAVITYYNNKNNKNVVEIPETISGRKVVAIGDYSFNYDNRVEKFIIPPTVESIDECAFLECENLKAVEMPDSVTSIGSKAFRNCEKLYDIKLSANLVKIDGRAFEDTGITELEIPEKVQTIGNDAFADCEKLKSVSMSDSVTSIGWYAFSGCNSLSSIKLSENITSIEEGVFEEDAKLYSITIPDKVTEINSEAFRKSGLKNITIPENVEKIDKGAFYKCSNMASYNVNSKNKFFSSRNGVLYNKERSKIIYYPAARSTKEFTVGKKVRTVGYASFIGAKKLNTVKFKKGVTAIKSHAFEKSGIKKVKLPKSVKTIGFRAFYECKKNKSVSIPTSVTQIGNQAFAYNTSLKSVKFKGNSKLKTGWGLFEDCDSLKIISMPKIKKSEGYLCLGCDKLKKVKIPKSVKTIFDSDFVRCKSLKKVTIPKTVKTIEDNAFGYSDYDYDEDDYRFYTKKSKFVIRGYKNSAAHKYAKKNKITFKAIK